MKQVQRKYPMLAEEHLNHRIDFKEVVRTASKSKRDHQRARNLRFFQEFKDQKKQEEELDKFNGVEKIDKKQDLVTTENFLGNYQD